MRFVLKGYVSLFACYWAAAMPLRVTVRVQNTAASESQVRAAEDEAAWLFRRANVETVWLACSPEAQQLAAGDPCSESDDPLAFTIRIMPIAAEAAGRNALGFAMPFAGNGNHAAVFYTRVVATAAANAGAVDASNLLGYVIAHELAHLIFHSTRHRSGIMRGDWSREELAMAGQRRLVFDAGDAAQLVQLLSRREIEWARRHEPAVQARAARRLTPDPSARFAAMP